MLTTRTTWQDIRDEVLRRIHARDWAPGGMIPNELDLARGNWPRRAFWTAAAAQARGWP